MSSPERRITEQVLDATPIVVTKVMTEKNFAVPRGFVNIKSGKYNATRGDKIGFRSRMLGKKRSLYNELT
jgi:hypothetical protein